LEDMQLEFRNPEAVHIEDESNTLEA
jgi:hypothetical protein